MTGADSAPSGGTRTVEHALGTTEVPVDPQRIVVLDSAYVLDNVVALGFGDDVVGRVDLNGIGDVEPSWLKGEIDFAQVEYLGSLHPDGVNLEKLAALEPDLVIGVGSAFGKQYDQISKIAPAVAPVMAEGYVVGAWDALTIATGTVLGREAEAQTLVSDAKAHLSARLAAAPAGLTDRTLTTLGGWTGDPTLYFTAAPDLIWMFQESAFELNPGFGDSTYELLTPELYDKIESQIIVITDFSMGTIDYQEFFARDSVLSSLTGFTDGQLIVVDGLLLASSGPLGQPVAVDAVFDALEAAWTP